MKKSKLFIATLLLVGVTLTACAQTEEQNGGPENEVVNEINKEENKDATVTAEPDTSVTNDGKDNAVAARDESFELPEKLSFTDHGEIKMRIFAEFDDMWDEVEDERAAYTPDFSSLDGKVLFDEQGIKGTFKAVKKELYLTVENNTDTWVDIFFEDCYMNGLQVDHLIFDKPIGKSGVGPGESLDFHYRDVKDYPRELGMEKIFNWEGILTVTVSEEADRYIDDREMLIGEAVNLEYKCDDRLRFSAGPVDVIVLNQRTYPTGNDTPSVEVPLLIVNNNEKGDDDGNAYVRLKSITINGVEFSDSESLRGIWDEYWNVHAGRARQKELNIHLGELSTVNDYESIEVVFEIEAEDEYGDEVFYYTNPIRFVNEK